MPQKKQMLFTVGQFARLHHINKRTLQYYSEIGLFVPACVGPNHYRYYTYQQSMDLEMILALRELEMPVGQIRDYMRSRSSSALQDIIAGQKQKIDSDIARLNGIRDMLVRKEELIETGRRADLEEMRIVKQTEEWLLCSTPIGSWDEEYLEILVEHTVSIPEPRLYNRTYGSMISVEKLRDGKYDEDDCFYSKIPDPEEKKGLHRKPAGRYLRTYCTGGWDLLPDVLERMLRYAEEMGLQLAGYAYEEGINELTISSMEEYITQIDIHIKDEEQRVL